MSSPAGGCPGMAIFSQRLGFSTPCVNMTYVNKPSLLALHCVANIKRKTYMNAGSVIVSLASRLMNAYFPKLKRYSDCRTVDLPEASVSLHRLSSVGAAFNCSSCLAWLQWRWKHLALAVYSARFHMLQSGLAGNISCQNSCKL